MSPIGSDTTTSPVSLGSQSMDAASSRFVRGAAEFVRRTSHGVLGLLCAASLALAQANGKLQIHYMDVGQGDGAVLISPEGQVVLFDDGVYKNCDKPVAYLQQLGVTGIDYHIASHYHADHIGCAPEVFAAYPLTLDAFDRGESYPGGVYQAYLRASEPTGRPPSQAP
jgi:beta-lactamase superfamily II metal-dependent hydrolase